MQNRIPAKQLVSARDIPNRLIGVVAGIHSASVSAFLHDEIINEATETRIMKAVEAIVSVLERFGSLRIDLEDPALFKELMLADQKASLYSVQLAQPCGMTLYFAGWGPGTKPVTETIYLLAAACAPYDQIDDLVQDVRSHGYPDAEAVRNPYALKANAVRFSDFFSAKAAVESNK